MNIQSKSHAVGVVSYIKFLKTFSGNTIEFCEKYEAFGFESQAHCIQSTSNLGHAKASNNGLGTSNKLVKNLLNILMLEKRGKQKLALQNRTRTDGAQLLSNKNFAPIKKITFKEVNEERGFDLTQAEIAKFKLWDRGVIRYFIDEYSFGKCFKEYNNKQPFPVFAQFGSISFARTGTEAHFCNENTRIQ